MLKVFENKRRGMPAVLAAAAVAAAVSAGVPAPAAQAAGPAVFSYARASQVPVPVAGLPAGVRQVSTGPGGNFALALLADGTVQAWGTGSGSNDFGQLGDGTTVSHTSPAPVHNLTGITQVSAGTDHGLAIGAGGQVWAWGNNGQAELGDGTLINRPTPFPIPGLTGIIQVSAGGGHNLAVRSDGTVWAWGSDSAGELGDGTAAAHRAHFQHVPGLTGITQVSAGPGFDSFAVRSDGTLFAWGLPARGQLGFVSDLDVTSPTPVPGLSGVTQVSAGTFYTLAIRGASHEVWGWGLDDVGQLGDGTEVIERDSPVRTTAGGASQVAAGANGSALIRTDGTLMTWGNQVLVPTAVTSLVGVTQVTTGNGINLVLGQAAPVTAPSQPTSVTVPNLKGDTVDEASTDLQNAGLVLGSQDSAVDKSCDFINEVKDQNPKAGTTVATGSAVSITIGTRPSTPCP